MPYMTQMVNMAAGTLLESLVIVLVSYFSCPLLIVNSIKDKIAEMLGGVDLSWLVGLLSTAVLYYVLAKRAQIKISKALQLERVK